MMLLWCLIEKFVLKFGFEKRGIFNKNPFLHKASNGNFWKGTSSEMMLLWCLIEKFVLKFGFEKRGIFNKNPFLHKASHGNFWKGTSSFLSTSIILGNQTNHRTNMFLTCKSNSRHESDYACICIVINGKIRSVPLNILSSVLSRRILTYLGLKLGRCQSM